MKTVLTSSTRNFILFAFYFFYLNKKSLFIQLKNYKFDVCELISKSETKINFCMKTFVIKAGTSLIIKVGQKFFSK